MCGPQAGFTAFYFLPNRTMQDASPTSPAGTKRIFPVHRRTGERLDLLISLQIDIPNHCKWRRIVKDLKTGTVYRIWNKGCGIGGCMCDAYAEEIETPTLATVTSLATPSAHTPGPWTLNREEVYGENGRTIVAEAFDEHDDWRANARLIAAAPELLEHLHSIVEMAHSVSANWESGDLAFAVRNLERIATAAETAIAKAEGRDCHC